MFLEMQKNRPSVSICIATYNGANCIVNQLQSVLEQLAENDEIVISDDKSTDETISLINSLADARIRIIINEGKSGPVSNFENAIQNATGEIMFLCDQDDIWFKNKVQRHIDNHQNYDLVVSDAVVTNEDMSVLFPSFFKQRGSSQGLITNMIRNSYIGCCMSFNRKILTQAIPFPRDIHMHDWWIGMVSELKGKICFLEEPLMYYIRHSNNASGTLVKTLPFYSQLYNRIIIAKNILGILTRSRTEQKSPVNS
jgi:glycosyltransferase involved in cell wall biosynthesis